MRHITAILAVGVLLFSNTSIARPPETRGNAGLDAGAVKSGGDQLTCEQIATELTPYAQ